MGLTLVDYQVARPQAVVPAGLVVPVLSLDPVPANYLWRIDQVSVAAFPAANANSGLGVGETVLLYDQLPNAFSVPVQGTVLQTFADAPLVGGQAEKQFGFQADFDDQGSPITIRPGDALYIVFAAIYPAGTVIGARVQYGIYQGSPGQPTPVAGASPAPAISAAL